MAETTSHLLWIKTRTTGGRTCLQALDVKTEEEREISLVEIELLSAGTIKSACSLQPMEIHSGRRKYNPEWEERCRPVKERMPIGIPGRSREAAMLQRFRAPRAQR